MLCATNSFGGYDPAPNAKKECWCKLPANADKKPARDRVAVVMLTRRPPDLKTWLQYHVEYMGVDHVFMDVEDSPHWNEAWQSLSQSLQQKVTVWKQTPHG